MYGVCRVLSLEGLLLKKRKAEEHRQALLNERAASLPFTQVISANIGNPQQLGQKPITFFRQVLSIMEYPDILRTEYATKIYPEDAIARAKVLLKEVGGVGAYSHSQGVPWIRHRALSGLSKVDNQTVHFYMLLSG